VPVIPPRRRERRGEKKKEKIRRRGGRRVRKPGTRFKRFEGCMIFPLIGEKVFEGGGEEGEEEGRGKKKRKREARCQIVAWRLSGLGCLAEEGGEERGRGGKRGR